MVFWVKNDGKSCNTNTQSLVFHGGPLSRVESEQLSKLGYTKISPGENLTEVYTKGSRRLNVAAEFIHSDLVQRTGLTFSLP